MAKTEKYSDDYKAKALAMFEVIGPNRTAKELGIANQTLYRWRAQQRKKEQPATEEKKTDSQQTLLEIENIPESTVHSEEEKHSEEVKNAPNNSANEVFLLNELKRLKAENQRLQGTLDYLIQENKDLLEKRQRCLEALSLLIQ